MFLAHQEVHKLAICFFILLIATLTSASPASLQYRNRAIKERRDFSVVFKKTPRSAITVQFGSRAADDGDSGNLATCSSKADCAGSRECIEDDSGDGYCLPYKVCQSNDDCSGGVTCNKLTLANLIFDGVCLKDLSALICDKTGDCDEDNGEICVEAKDVDGFCISKKFADSKNIDEVCIAMHHLDEHGIPRQLRVFDTDYRAWVLCDVDESCATAGHMVVWNDRAMMMKSYCEIVGCERKIMKVNSPKYSRQARIGSRSKGLHFTAFAAKWATATEERALSGLIRVGL